MKFNVCNNLRLIDGDHCTLDLMAVIMVFRNDYFNFFFLSERLWALTMLRKQLEKLKYF